MREEDVQQGAKHCRREIKMAMPGGGNPAGPQGQMSAVSKLVPLRLGQCPGPCDPPWTVAGNCSLHVHPGQMLPAGLALPRDTSSHYPGQTRVEKLCQLVTAATLLLLTRLFPTFPTTSSSPSLLKQPCSMAGVSGCSEDLGSTSCQ